MAITFDTILRGTASVPLEPRAVVSRCPACHAPDERIASMLERARELAGRGHYPYMIEAVANGFPEAAEWIDRPDVAKELKEIADQARRQASTGPEAS